MDIGRQVEDYIKSLPDVDLLEYTRCKTHLPEALEFAQIELTERHLSSEKMAELDEQLRQRAKEVAETAQAIAAEPLYKEWRIAVFLCGIYFGIPLLFFIPAWLRLREKGAYRQSRDMCVYAVAGFCSQLILVLLRIPPWSWLTRLF